MCVYFSFIFLFLRLRRNKIKTAFRTKCLPIICAQKHTVDSNKKTEEKKKYVNRNVLRSFAFLVHSDSYSVYLVSIITQLIQLFNSTLKVSFKPLSGRSNHSWRQRHNFHFYLSCDFFYFNEKPFFVSQCNATQHRKCFWCVILSFSCSLLVVMCVRILFLNFTRVHLSLRLRFDVLITVKYFTTILTIWYFGENQIEILFLILLYFGKF